jgi:ribosomal-protein-alanine N-acetyltransferase
MTDVAVPYPDPDLSDGRVGLRRWRESDVECVRLAGTDTDIPRGTTVPARYTPAEGVAFIHRQWRRASDGQGVSLAIADLTDDRAVGLMRITPRPQPYVVGLGYWVIPSARGRGTATAAVRLASAWALDQLGFRRVEAWVRPGNVASQRVLSGAGFEPEGRLRNFLTLTDGDGPYDVLVFSVIR